MPPERRSPLPPDDESFSAWPLLIAIGTVKLITLITILVFAWGYESTTLIASTLLPWIGAVAALLAAPLIWQFRKRRARRRRASLLAAEFMDADSADPPQHSRRTLSQHWERVVRRTG